MKSGWTLGTCANAHKTCDNFQKSAEDLFEIIKSLEEHFILSTDKPHLICGLDTAVSSVNIGGETITIGWDNWSGIFIMASTDGGDKIVEQIYCYLKDQA